MSLVAGLGYLLVGSTDMPGWHELASDIGIAVVDDPQRGGSRLRLDEWSLRLLVTHAETDGVTAIGWQVANKSVFDDVVGRVRAHGIEVTVGDRQYSAHRAMTQVASFTDPAGFPVEVAYGPHVDPVNRLVTPHGVRFTTGTFGLGHVVIHVEDFEAEVSFYVDVLGFSIRDTLDVVPGAFLGCNPRHHSIAILGVGQPGLNHIMVELADLDDVGRAYDRQLDKGSVNNSLGRWGPDEMISFYVGSPSGFDIEVGFGGTQVGPHWCERRLALSSGSTWGHRPLA
jgi:3,4-dihydroxy-9,10-secoandrosta-1,3,5(10)-triene-9,17-dione 4,5-dioxygenase